MFMSVSWDRLMAMSFLTVVEDRSVGLSDTIRPRCPEADRHIRKCQGKRRIICTNFSLLEVQSSLTIGLSFRTNSNIFGFEVGPHVHALSALRKDGDSSKNCVSPLMNGRGKKKSHCNQTSARWEVNLPCQTFRVSSHIPASGLLQPKR